MRLHHTLVSTSALILLTQLSACSDGESTVYPWTGRTQDCQEQSGDAAMPAEQCVPLVFMTWNVGNGNTETTDYPLRLTSSVYEQHVAAKIQEIEPDVVFLQEVLNPVLCDSVFAPGGEQDPGRTCFDAANRPPQVNRLLGPNYTVACDANLQADCIGIRHDRIEMTLADQSKAEPGSYNPGGALTPPFPAGVTLCNYAEGNCNENTCDSESSVSAVNLSMYGVPFKAIHAHPNAPGVDATGTNFTGAACRAGQLRAATVVLHEPSLPNILAGDFNSVWPSPLTEVELVWWNSYSRGNPFTEIDAKDDSDRHMTSSRNFGVTVDHVWIDKLQGSCELYGESLPIPGGQRSLDADFDWSDFVGGESFAGRIDHHPQICQLQLPVEYAKNQLTEQQ